MLNKSELHPDDPFQPGEMFQPPNELILVYGFQSCIYERLDDCNLSNQLQQSLTLAEASEVVSPVSNLDSQVEGNFIMLASKSGSI